MRVVKTTLSAWSRFKAKAEIPNNGPMELVLHKPGLVSAVSTDGEIIFMGFDAHFRLATDAAFYVSDVACAVRQDKAAAVVPSNTLTNLEKMPTPSAAEIAVTAAIRKMQLQERSRRQKILQDQQDRQYREAMAENPDPDVTERDETPAPVEPVEVTGENAE